MKTHFTIRRTKRDVFRLRLFLTAEDADQYRYTDRILVTRSGRDWVRYGFARQVEPYMLYNGWAWDCTRQHDKELVECFGDLEPGERRYYGVRLTMEGIFVKTGTPLKKEEIE